jgi:ubiquinone/menaquinone biosynthesis C-methylase UbiE
MPGRLYPLGLLNDWFLEPLLARIRKYIAKLFLEQNLFPALDICCGAGRQCRLLNVGDEKMIGLDKNFRILNHARYRQHDLPCVCADALRLPFRGGSFRGILLSFSLHDKSPELRAQIIAEARRILGSGGKLVILDFERPWNRRSRLGWLFTSLIERTAGREHFRNGRQFLREGGLSAFIAKSGLAEVNRRPIEAGNSAVVVCEFISILS